MWMTEYDEQAMWDDIREAYQEELEEKTAKVIASEKARADDAEAERDAEKSRADDAEAERDAEKNRADKAETIADSLAELARRYGIPEEQIAAAEGR